MEDWRSRCDLVASGRMCMVFTMNVKKRNPLHVIAPNIIHSLIEESVLSNLMLWKFIVDVEKGH